MFNNQIIAGSSGQGGGSFYSYSIDQSLRFEESGAANLTFTPSNNGTDNKKFTYSVWIKRGQSSADDQHLIQSKNTGGGTGQGHVGFILDTSDSLDVYTQNGGANPTGTRLLRDRSGWYHCCFVYDTTEATASDRVKVYINGDRDTLSGSFPPLNSVVSSMNYNGQEQYIGKYVAGFTRYFNGYMAEIHMVDGQALSPTDFAEEVNGVWVPKEYTDNGTTSHGVNGYHLDFADSSAIGNDVSGNNNDWTANNLAASDVVLDSPTNNFATWNVLQPAGAASGVMTLSEGNMKATGGSSIYRQVMGNMSVLSGKWYTELYITDAGYPSWTFGWTKATRYEAYTGAGNQSTHHASIGYFTGSNLYITDFGSASVATRTLSYSSNGSPTTGSIIGCAADFDNGKLWWSVNGTWVDIGSGAGDPANDTNPASTFTVSTYADDFKTPHFLNYNGSAVLNTGQDSTFAGNTTAGGNSDENGVGDFKYSVPSGFLALASSSLPESDIGPNSAKQADDYFNTVVYTGNGTAIASGGISVTGVNFQPDFVWIKNRTNAYDNMLFDSVRGRLKILKSNSTAAEITSNTENLDSFDADGFTYGSELSGNASGASHVAWNWKAGGTAVSNTDGSITSQVSAAPDAGFAVGTYTGNATAGATIGHSLGEIPEMVIVKRRTNARDWAVYHKDQSATPTNAYMLLNSTAAVGVGSTAWNNGTFTSSVFTIGSHELVNFSGDSYVFYAFRGIDGHSKCGSYVGNGSANGTFIYTGFRPAWVMVKGAGNTYSWYINDSTRDTFNHTDAELVANSSSAEYSAEGAGGGERSDFLSNGFKVRTSNVGWNQSGITYIYLAFAEQPFKYSNAR
jgi:hypothetical protein